MTLLEVGRVARSHGLKGEVLVRFTTDLVDERTAAGAELTVGGHPFVVEAARPHKGAGHYLVRFVGVQDRDAADALRGATVEAEALDETDAVFVHEVIGRTLVDQHEVAHGSVVAVIDNPASDLMELEDGRLVPFAFLVELADGVVRVDVPLGLLDDS